MKWMKGIFATENNILASKNFFDYFSCTTCLGFFSYFNHSYSYSYAYVLSHKNSTCRDIDKLLCFFCRKKYYLCCVRQYYYSNTIFKIFTLKPEDGEKIRNLVSNISYFSIEFGRKSDDHVIMYMLCELHIMYVH